MILSPGPTECQVLRITGTITSLTRNLIPGSYKELAISHILNPSSGRFGVALAWRATTYDGPPTMAPGRGNGGQGDSRSNGFGGGRGGKTSRYQRQQAKGSGGKGGKKTYADSSQAARLSGGGRKETTLKAALREKGDELDKRFGCVSGFCLT